MAGNRAIFERAMEQSREAARQGSWDESLRAAVKALQEFSQDADARTAAAVALFNTGKLDRALQVFEELRAADPSNRYYRSVGGTSPTAYRVSKVAVNMLMVEYWKQYGLHEGGRLRVYTADPGASATAFLGFSTPEKQAEANAKGIPNPDVGAKQLVACIKGDRDGGEGKMWGSYGQSPW